MSRIVVVLILCASLYAQMNSNESPSLGDVARQTRQNRSGVKTKTVITDESLGTRKTLFPAIHPELDNSEEIVKAMLAYAFNHSQKETENAIHEWYDTYDQKMAAAIREQKDIKDRQLQRSMSEQEMYENGPEDYRKYRALRRAESRTAISDQQTLQTDSLLTAKIQQTFQAVRAGLQRSNIRYEWFKIRFGNGNGSW